MASYKILPLRDDGIDPETIRNRVERLSALDADADLRSGTLPRTFQAFRGEMCYVEYAKEEYAEVTTLDGDAEGIKVADMYPIMFLGNGYVAYDANLPNTETETEIIGIVADLLDADIRFEPVTFDPDTLDAVVAQSDKVREADFAPETGAKPQAVSARHIPGLQETELWENYASDPLEKVRVELPNRSVYNISFYEQGKITVHGREIPVEVQVDVIRYITDEVVSHLNITTFQQTLGGIDQ